ncbi:MAG: sulfite exporter TauE/SafE family protein [Saprospiraceae bacterium]|nr:sulfite exporter TauE/SafE family protein [Saprospiraceae bacterium]
MQAYILFFLFTLLCEIIGTVGGFGSSVIFVPLAQWFFSFKIVLVLTSILHVFSNISKIGMFWQHIDRRFFLLYGVPSLLFSIIGAWLTAHTSLTYGELILGAFLIVFSGFFLLFPNKKLPANNANALTSGSLAGFLAGFVGTGGAVRGASMAAFDLEKNVFVATSGAIDFGVDASRMIVYLNNGFLTPQYWSYIPLLFVASVVGTYFGKLVLNRISQEVFKRIVLILIFLIGLSMVLKAFL